MNYEPPIRILTTDDICGQIACQQDNNIMVTIRQYVDVDKDELIKALNYDRQQYEKGYEEGVKSVRQSGEWTVDEFAGYKDFHCPFCQSIGQPDMNWRFCAWCGARLYETQQ